jgi:hypothetical protein
MVERMPEGSENKLTPEASQNDMTLILGRAISNVEDAKHAVNSKDRVYLEGLAENFRGALAWKATRLVVTSSMVWGLAQGCSPRTATAQDIIAATTAVTENYTPTPTAEFIPTLEVTKEPTKSADGNLIPVPEAFANLGLGKITSIEKTDPSNPVFAEINKKAAEKFKVDGGNIKFAGLDLVREKGKSLYVLVVNKKDGKRYSVFSTDQDGFYIPPALGEDMQFLPMMVIDRPASGNTNPQRLFGFDVDGALVNAPFVIDQITQGITFTDPGDSTSKTEVSIETGGGGKVLALLINPMESLGIGEPTPTATNTPEVVWELPKVCTDYKKVESEGNLVTLEDVTSGRMVEADKAAAKKLGKESFPPEAYAGGNLKIVESKVGDSLIVKNVFFDHGTFENPDPTYNDYFDNPTKRPYRWISFNKVVIPWWGTNKGALIATQQWLNPSGKITYLHYVTSISNTIYSKRANKFTFEEMHFGFPQYDYKNSNKEFPQTFYTDDVKNLLDKWVQTGEIPDELQKKILVPVSISPILEKNSY